MSRRDGAPTAEAGLPGQAAGRAPSPGPHSPSSSREPREAVERTARHWATQLIARSGLAARGVVYLLVGFVTAQIALTSAGDQRSGTRHSASGPGAVHTLAGGFGGRATLLALAAGLAGYAVFSILDAILHHNDADKSRARRWAERLLSLWGAALYAAFCVWTVHVALSPKPGKTSAGKSSLQKASLTSDLLSWPAGQFIVAAVAAVIGIAGVALMRRALKRTFLERFERSDMSPRSWHILGALGGYGILARALAYWVITGMILSAAIENNPSQGQGLDGSLRTVAREGWGPYLLFPIALGFFAFGLYLFLEARFRKVSGDANSRNADASGECQAGTDDHPVAPA